MLHGAPMILADARMYSPTPGAAAAWRDLFGWLSRAADVPLELVEPNAPLPELWRRRDLGACFICGWQLAKRASQLKPLAAPVMCDAHAQGRAVYWTDFVVRFGADFRRLEDTFRHRIAFTTKHSHAGYNAARHHLLGFPNGRGGHFYSEVAGPVGTTRAAALAVAEGVVEVAALDAYAHALLRRYEPNLALGLRVVERSELSTMPPLAASAGLDPRKVTRLTDALIGSAVDPEARPILSRLELKSFAPIDPSAYEVTLAWEKEAFDRNYPEIA